MKEEKKSDLVGDRFDFSLLEATLPSSNKHIQEFLTSLFKFPSDKDNNRYADAVIEVQKVAFDVASSVQSNITKIFTKFVLQDGAKRTAIDISDGCREEDAIEFLLTSFDKCNLELGKDNLPSNSKFVLETTKTVILSLFVMIQRDNFHDQLQKRRASFVFVKRLLNDTISSNFIEDLIEYTVNGEDEETTSEVFNHIFDILRAAIDAKHFERNGDDDVKQILRVMNLLLNVFVGSEEDAMKIDESVNLEQQGYMNRMSMIRGLLHQMILPLISDPASKTKTLKWFSAVINARRRRNLHGSADGHHFMVNFLSVMYRLSEKTDISKIIMEYPFLPGTLVDIKKETRIKMDEQSALTFAAQFADRPVEYDFSTVCFFLTIAAQQLVFPPLMRQIYEHSRHINDIEQKLEAMREKLKTLTGIERSRLEQLINLENENWQLMCRHLLCLKTHSEDPAIVAAGLDFVNKQMKLVMNSLCPNLDIMRDDSQLPAEPTALFCAYPEYYLEGAFDFYIFAIETSTNLLMESNTEWIARLIILFIHYDYIKSPFLVAKLVGVLANLHNSFWFHMISLQMAQDKLLHCLIKFYSEFEDNGEFDEKFNVRGTIQRMLEKLVDNVVFKAKFKNMAEECSIEFVRFANMVINDATWSMDEIVSTLKIINRIEKKMEHEEAWDQSTRNQQMERLEESKGGVGLWLDMANTDLKLILSIANSSSEPFQTPALGQRLAVFLNHNLAQLLSDNVKVNAPNDFEWHPREFLNRVASIYLGINTPIFFKYIAYDERTYNPTFFQNVIEQMKKRQIVSKDQLKKFEELAEEVKKEYTAKAELEEEYGDVPEEFKDPIMDGIMLDPVRLPSGHVMDRAVIERHLLSTPNNPFNRAPLELKELVPDEELKSKIDEWIAQKRKFREG
uniref:RING-type E3 ubiquitin transferase n=1 Tax=Caenorhabditis tropicalis TaxID=1561998 RepID=A0A1I7V3R5_9PELO